jgi:hypothetical protein
MIFTVFQPVPAVRNNPEFSGISADNPENSEPPLKGGFRNFPNRLVVRGVPEREEERHESGVNTRFPPCRES